MLTKEPNSEQEWADYYQEHKEDPEIWGEPELPPLSRLGRPGKRLTMTTTVRFSPEDAAMIRKVAEAKGVSTYSEVIRRATRAYATVVREGREITG